MLRHFETEQWVPIAVERVFRFFVDPNNLPRIMPAATGTKVVDIELVAPAGVPANPCRDVVFAGPGSKVVTTFRIIPYLPFRKHWIARITEFEWNRHFADVQEKGPFKSFHHRHQLMPQQRQGKVGTVIKDLIDYEIGLGCLDSIANLFVSRQLQQTFQHRQNTVAKILLPE